MLRKIVLLTFVKVIRTVVVNTVVCYLKEFVILLTSLKIIPLWLSVLPSLISMARGIALFVRRSVVVQTSVSALFLMGSISGAFAQEATIIEIKGEVFLRQDSQSQWEEAQLNKVITQDWEIKTKRNASCTVAFDTKRKNIITVKDNTEIKVESVLPSRVFLPEGRVFALIKNLSENKKFEVRTPTAISGARGTGWLTEVVAGETNISCFDEMVFVGSLDPSGAVTGQIDLAKGLEVNIEEKAVELTDVKPVSEVSMQEWQGFVESVQHIIGPEMTGPRPGPGGQIPPAPGSHPNPATGFQMNKDQLLLEAQKQLGNNPEKLAEFERMMQEGQKRFGSDFERYLMSGGEGNETFESFMQEMIQKFGDEFQIHPPQHGTGTSGGPNGEGGQMPPPLPPPPPPPPPPDGDHNQDWDNPNFYSGPGPDSGFHDALYEKDQTRIDSNLQTCGHYCCPHPTCCAAFSNPGDNAYCLSH